MIVNIFEMVFQIIMHLIILKLREFVKEVLNLLNTIFWSAYFCLCSECSTLKINTWHLHSAYSHMIIDMIQLP